MKKAFALFLCMLLAAALTAPAMADLIWEPADNFYFEHMDECRRIDEEFLAEENTFLYKSPQDATRTGVIPAGESQLVSYVWTDSRGYDWGYVEFWKDGAMTHGWVSLSVSDAAPLHATQTLPVVLIVCALAAAAVVIVFIRPKKR